MDQTNKPTVEMEIMGADLTEQIKNLKNLKSGYFGAFSSQKS
jgi:hypothetical protein